MKFISVLKDILKNNGNNKNQDLEKKELSTSVLHYHKTTQYHNTYQEVNCGHNNVEFGHITFCVQLLAQMIVYNLYHYIIFTSQQG